MKTKICSNPKCKKEKLLKEFTKDKNKKDGLTSYCKDCIKLLQKEWYQKNKKKVIKNSLKWRENNKEKIKQYNNEVHKNYPWKRHFHHLKQRCNNPNTSSYSNYGGRGIKYLITEEELKFLWFRDKAWLLKIPSIDREDNDGNYTLDNCRFIEHRVNSGKDKFKPILQFTLDGDFIKEWGSATKIEVQLKIYHSNISKCCRGKQKTCGGYKWKYKNET